MSNVADIDSQPLSNRPGLLIEEDDGDIGQHGKQDKTKTDC